MENENKKEIQSIKDNENNLESTKNKIDTKVGLDGNSILEEGIVETTINHKVTLNKNVKTTMILIQKDKAKGIINLCVERLIKGNSWKAPLTAFITLGIPLVTADFKKFLFFEPIFIYSIFLAGFMISIYFFIRSLFSVKIKNSKEYISEELLETICDQDWKRDTQDNNKMNFFNFKWRKNKTKVERTRNNKSIKN